MSIHKISMSMQQFTRAPAAGTVDRLSRHEWLSSTGQTGMGQEAAAYAGPQDLLVDGLHGGICRRGRGRVPLDAARVLAARGITTIDRSWGGGSWPGCRDVRSPSSDPPEGSVAGRRDGRTCCRTTT